MRKLVVDTNCFMVDNFDWFIENKDNYEYILTNVVLQELDHLKIDRDRGYKARKGINFIKDNLDLFTWHETEFSIDKCDDAILEVCQTLDCELLTLDTVMQIKAEFYGVKYIVPEFKKCEYKGYKIVQLDDEELANWYEGNKENKWGLVVNEYLVIQNKDGETVDKYKWTNEGFKQIQKKTLDSTMFGKVKPKDEFQEFAIDSLLNERFSVITGKAGSGKTFLSLSYCMWALQNGKYHKLVIVYNPVKVRGTADLGYYTGDKLEKIMQTSLGGILTSKFGDTMMVATLINQNKLSLIPASEIRGYEVDENSILYVTECQNTNKDILKLIISRASEKTKIILEGDVISQVDRREFEGNLNGLRRAIEVFKGEDIFSYVELPNVHRSKMAEIADKM